MLILGIDPGIARVGWGIIKESSNNSQAVEYGCFTTLATTPEADRLVEINQFIGSLIDRFKPDVMAIEKLFFAANSKTALTVGQARGAILLTASQMNLPTAAYTPLEVKQAITGYGRADKKQIQSMVKSILKLAKPITQDDTADALAIALTHAFSYKLRAKTI